MYSIELVLKFISLIFSKQTKKLPRGRSYTTHIHIKKKQTKLRSEFFIFLNCIWVSKFCICDLDLKRKRLKTNKKKKTGKIPTNTYASARTHQKPNWLKVSIVNVWLRCNCCTHQHTKNKQTNIKTQAHIFTQHTLWLRDELIYRYMISTRSSSVQFSMLFFSLNVCPLHHTIYAFQLAVEIDYAFEHPP